MLREWRTRTWLRLKALLNREQFDRDLDDELQFHLAKREEKLTTAGVGVEDAHFASRRQFGNSTSLREATRQMWVFTWLEDFWHDLRFGARMLRKNPGFTALGVLTLALGIGATTTIFSVIDGLILRKPPVPDPNYLVIVSSTKLAGASDGNRVPVSAPDYLDWREQADDFTAMAAGHFSNFTISGGSTPQFVSGARVSADFFQILGVQPIWGRLILPGDDQPGKDHVVVLSEGLWKGTFGADRQVLDRAIKINGNSYTIAGVMPDGVLPWDFEAQIWMPLVFSRDELGPERRSFRFLQVFARLKPGAGVSKAAAQMKTVAQRIAQAHSETNKDWGANVMTLQQYSVADSGTEKALVFLMAAVSFVLLIACVNLAGLLLARNAKRNHEFSLRAVLGAGRIRLGQQLLTECLMLSLAGGALGTLFAFVGVRGVVSQLTWNVDAIAVARSISVDGRVLIFTAAISMLAAFVFGIVPALLLSLRAPGIHLKDGGRGITSGRDGLRLQRLIVIGQLALSLILLIGAGMFVEGFVAEMRASVGFNSSKILTASVSLRGLQFYGAPAREATFFGDVLRQIESSPQVESASVSSTLPFNFPDSVYFATKDHPTKSTAEQFSCGHFAVGPEYFKTLAIPLLRGREFAPSDTANSAPVAIVNQAFAIKYFPNEDALGRHILIRHGDRGQDQWSEIVGEVGDIKEFLGQVRPRPHIFEPFLAQPVNTMSFVVRTRMEPASFSDSLRRAVWAVDSEQAVSDLKTMDRVIADSGYGDDVMAELMGAFAVIALVLAAIGVYGLLSFLVGRRTHEFGIRMALGAKPKQVLGMVMRGGLILISSGVTIGLIVSLMLPKVVRSLFAGFEFNVGWVFATTFVLVFLIAVTACWIPARRAMRLDPMVALRHD
jgi:predicted permease